MKLRTTIQIAIQRAAALRTEALASDWRRRLDPAAYRCRREGPAWVADGPAGQRFEFRAMPDRSEVECRSGSGMSYILRRACAGWVCSCPSPDDPCKHEQGWVAVLDTARELRERRLAA